MKTALALVLVFVTALAAGCGSSAKQSAQSASSATLPERPPSVLFGHIDSMTRSGGDFELKFDPARSLSGVAAQRAALEDTGSSDVPNDYYVVDESHRLLTFVVRRDAAVTVVTHGGSSPRSCRSGSGSARATRTQPSRSSSSISREMRRGASPRRRARAGRVAAAARTA